jgi:hypothetical protein
MGWRNDRTDAAQQQEPTLPHPRPQEEEENMAAAAADADGDTNKRPLADDEPAAAAAAGEQQAVEGIAKRACLDHSAEADATAATPAEGVSLPCAPTADHADAAQQQEPTLPHPRPQEEEEDCGTRKKRHASDGGPGKSTPPAQQPQQAPTQVAKKRRRPKVRPIVPQPVAAATAHVFDQHQTGGALHSAATAVAVTGGETAASPPENDQEQQGKGHSDSSVVAGMVVEAGVAAGTVDAQQQATAASGLLTTLESLRSKIAALPLRWLGCVVQLVENSQGVDASAVAAGEVEIDFLALTPETVRRLWDFVAGYEAAADTDDGASGGVATAATTAAMEEDGAAKSSEQTVPRDTGKTSKKRSAAKASSSAAAGSSKGLPPILLAKGDVVEFRTTHSNNNSGHMCILEVNETGAAYWTVGERDRIVRLVPRADCKRVSKPRVASTLSALDLAPGTYVYLSALHTVALMKERAPLADGEPLTYITAADERVRFVDVTVLGIEGCVEKLKKLEDRQASESYLDLAFPDWHDMAEQVRSSVQANKTLLQSGLGDISNLCGPIELAGGIFKPNPAICSLRNAAVAYQDCLRCVAVAFANGVYKKNPLMTRREFSTYWEQSTVVEVNGQLSTPQRWFGFAGETMASYHRKYDRLEEHAWLKFLPFAIYSPSKEHIVALIDLLGFDGESPLPPPHM